MEWIKTIVKSALTKWKLIYVTYKVIFIICMLSFISIIVSVFDNNLEASGNLASIRSTFSSIIGLLLEDNTKSKIVCNDKNMFFRNLVVGIISIVIVMVVIICYIYNIDTNNSSLILLKNVLASCIGFLISASKDCGK